MTARIPITMQIVARNAAAPAMIAIVLRSRVMNAGDPVGAFGMDDSVLLLGHGALLLCGVGWTVSVIL